MKVRVKQSFHTYKAGQEFDWPRPMSKILAARGLVEFVEDEEVAEVAEVETAEMPEQSVERAVAPKKPRRRRK